MNSASKERASATLCRIAGDLADIAANPPTEIDGNALAKLASQLLAVAGHVYLGESARNGLECGKCKKHLSHKVEDNGWINIEPHECIESIRASAK